MTQPTAECPEADPALNVLLSNAVSRAPSSAALDFLGRKTSAAQFATAVALATADLMRLGVGPASAVALMLPASPATFVFALALETLGATLVPLDPDAPVPMLVTALTTDVIDLLITSDLEPLHSRALDIARLATVPALHVISYTDMLAPMKAVGLHVLHGRRLARPPTQLTSKVTHERELRRDSRRQRSELSVPVGANSFAIRLHTFVSDDGVTTATLTSANLAATCAQLKDAVGPLRQGQERILSTLPLWHPLSLVISLGLALGVSAELVVLDDTLPAAVSRAVERRDPTVLIASPEHLTHVTRNPTQARALLSHVRLILVTGAPASSQLRAALAHATPARVLDLHLLTVIATVLAVTDAADLATAPACRPLARARISVRDGADLSRDMARGERGEITCAGPHIPTAMQITQGSRRFLSDGFRTGELGILGPDGRLFPVDRVDDLIISRGYLIFPRRIEAALLEHPAIAEAAVHAVTTPAGGRVPTATLVLKPGAVVTVGEVMTHLASRISRIEMPEMFVFAAALPKTPFGAIDKEALRRPVQKA